MIWNPGTLAQHGVENEQKLLVHKDLCLISEFPMLCPNVVDSWLQPFIRDHIWHEIGLCLVSLDMRHVTKLSTMQQWKTTVMVLSSPAGTLSARASKTEKEETDRSCDKHSPFPVCFYGACQRSICCFAIALFYSCHGNKRRLTKENRTQSSVRSTAWRSNQQSRKTAASDWRLLAGTEHTQAVLYVSDLIPSLMWYRLCLKLSFHNLTARLHHCHCADLSGFVFQVLNLIRLVQVFLPFLVSGRPLFSCINGKNWCITCHYLRLRHIASFFVCLFSWFLTTDQTHSARIRNPQVEFW